MIIIRYIIRCAQHGESISKILNGYLFVGYYAPPIIWLIWGGAFNGNIFDWSLGLLYEVAIVIGFIVWLAETLIGAFAKK